MTIYQIGGRSFYSVQTRSAGGCYTANGRTLADAVARCMAIALSAPYKLSQVQLEAIMSRCPHCERGELHATQDQETGETYLWCNACDLSMDSDGGYIA